MIKNFLMSFKKLPDSNKAMIFRELSLWGWSIWVTLILIILVKNWINLKKILKIWLCSTWTFLILAWLSIYLHMKFEK